MRCKKIIIIAVLLMFLAMLAVPLMASNQPRVDPPPVKPRGYSPTDGSRREDPWQDIPGGGGGLWSLCKGVNYFISAFYMAAIKVEKDHFSKLSPVTSKTGRVDIKKNNKK